MDLSNQKCVPCQVGAPTLKGEDLKKYLSETPTWEIYDSDTKIKKEFEFSDFSRAISFVNEIAKLAQEQGHHPNIYIYDYKKVLLELWTHKIGGLHQNDFIMASKIDNLKAKD